MAARISYGNEVQRSDAATGIVRRPTVVSRNRGTSSWCGDEFPRSVCILLFPVSVKVENDKCEMHIIDFPL